MIPRIDIVTATEMEASALRQAAESLGSGADDSYCGSINVVVTGIGMVSSARSLMKHFAMNGIPALAINAGIGGTYAEQPGVGDVVVVERDCFADLGIDDNGRFIKAAEARFINAGTEPFDDEGWIWCRNRYIEKVRGRLPFCSGITSDTVSGSEERIGRLRGLYGPDIESMEGASFFYICSLEKVPFIALRSISNRVEVRDRRNWHIERALKNLGERTEEIIRLLSVK